MKPIQIISVDDERTLVRFTIPIKGRRPLQLKLPRFEFIPEAEFDELNANIEALAEEKLPMRKYTRRMAFVMLKPFVSDKDYAALETLVTGELDQVLDGWRDSSEMSLGEFVASANSSTENMGAPSDTTSKPASESSGETSDAESGGTTSETS